MKCTIVEYIWLDGCKPTQELRSKARILPYNENLSLTDLPQWSFDGSSTNQASGDKSDCALQPVRFVKDPIRGQGNYLVLCEVNNADGSPHSSNTRAQLRRLMEASGGGEDAYIGFEQEYTFFKQERPLGWPEGGYPAPQGPFFCSVGASTIFGRPIVEEHTNACIEAGLAIYGINAEVMPSQWEFQIGYRSFADEAADPLTLSDHLWLARYLLHRIAEKYDTFVSLASKPVKGDWNGAGMHTNFSTRSMRAPQTGKTAIARAIEKLAANHKRHIDNYGANNHERLTGHHETCSIDQFRYGVSDRGASIRIPLQTAQNGYGYIEDRRPSANADPYKVASCLISTICDVD